MADAARLTQLRAHLDELQALKDRRAAELSDAVGPGDALVAALTADAQWLALNESTWMVKREADEIESFLAARADTGFRDYLLREVA